MAQAAADKWKMKKWFTVYAPKIFNEAQVCEIPGNDDNAVIGRNIKVGLNTLTNNQTHAYTNATLKVMSVNGEAAHTKLVMLEELYSYVRSLVRRYKSVATLVKPVMTKDNVPMVAKMLVVTHGRVAHSKINGLRAETSEFVSSFFSANDADSAIGAILEGKMQSELASKLRHITPVSKVEVRKLEVK